MHLKLYTLLEHELDEVDLVLQNTPLELVYEHDGKGKRRRPSREYACDGLAFTLWDGKHFRRILPPAREVGLSDINTTLSYIGLYKEPLECALTGIWTTLEAKGLPFSVVNATRVPLVLETWFDGKHIGREYSAVVNSFTPE